jgi:hypothetical protein
MKARPLLCFLVLASLNTGCSVLLYSFRNMVESPSKAIDYCFEKKRFVAWAREAWKHIQAADPSEHYSEDYVCGFIDGYVDFIDADGTGEPPAAPPDRYHYSRYETPAGLAAIEDWFAGFRHGAAAARASGQRELVVLPLSLPPRSSRDYGPRSTNPPAGRLPQQAAPPATTEELPPPRKMPAVEDIPPPQKVPPVPAQPQAGVRGKVLVPEDDDR